MELMKITVKDLKRIIAEAPKDTQYMNELDAEEFIAARDPDSAAKQDIVDEDDGFVYIEAGTPYGEAKFKAEPETDSDEDLESELEDEEETYNPTARYDAAISAFHKAADEFASSYSNWSEETGWGDWDGTSGSEDDYENYNPDSVCSDAAEGFFAEYPEWREWADAMHRGKSSMKEYITDIVYDAMIGSVKK